MAFNKPGGSGAGKPEQANAFSVDQIKNFGNTQMDGTISALMDGARTSENERAMALASAFETGAVRTIECDAVFAAIGQLPEGELRDSMAARASAVRKSLRWNAGFGARMREFKPTDPQARFQYAQSLHANMVSNGAIPSRITANNIAAQAPTYAEAQGVLGEFEKAGVTSDASSDTVLLSKAIAEGDKTTANGHLLALKAANLDGRLAKIVGNLEVKLSALSAEAAE